MSDRDIYTSGHAYPFSRFTREHILAGKQLCRELLEPLIREFGPCSIAAGACITMAPNQGPHLWTEAAGAAADVVFHDWVNAGRAPFHINEHIIRERIPFERIISYAGSEFMCMATKKYVRHALYENVRIAHKGGEKPNFITYSKNQQEARNLILPFPERPDWRREEGEVIYHTRRSIRPQHIRVGRYFTLLDFCHSEIGLERGFNTVPPLIPATEPITQYARMFAEVLEPLVTRYGRVSVTRGIEPKSLATLYSDGALHRWLAGEARVEFLMSQTGATDSGIDTILSHPSVLDIDITDHPSEALHVGVTIKPFTPKKIWSSAVQPARARSRAPRGTENNS